MKKRNRVLPISLGLLTMLLTAAFALSSCSGSNDPAKKRAKRDMQKRANMAMNMDLKTWKQNTMPTMNIRQKNWCD
ncbi:MAG: hypothetical protein IPP40_16415 [bacterium]|nr:hypothetical protein [bacterium]